MRHKDIFEKKKRNQYSCHKDKPPYQAPHLYYGRKGEAIISTKGLKCMASIYGCDRLSISCWGRDRTRRQNRAASAGLQRDLEREHTQWDNSKM